MTTDRDIATLIQSTLVNNFTDMAVASPLFGNIIVAQEGQFDLHNKSSLNYVLHQQLDTSYNVGQTTAYTNSSPTQLSTTTCQLVKSKYQISCYGYNTTKCISSSSLADIVQLIFNKRSVAQAFKDAGVAIIGVPFVTKLIQKDESNSNIHVNILNLVLSYYIEITDVVDKALTFDHDIRVFTDHKILN
jgi:hypothetical protein